MSGTVVAVPPRVARALDLLNFSLADVRDGLGPYLSIYLLLIHDWDQASIGFVMAVGGIAAIVAQTPIGALVDRTTAKRALDCNESTLLVNGTQNIVTALGTCWAVTVMGSSNTVVADTIINDITVYGWDETVFFRNGDPFIWDRGRELGMVNRLQRVG